MRPSRISSEAPEVVPAQQQQYGSIQSPENNNTFLGSAVNLSNNEYNKKPGEERVSQYKQLDPRETETNNYPPPRSTPSPAPLLAFDPVAFRGREEIPTYTQKKQKPRKILTICILMFIAFLVGGGIGGGVGGGLVLQAKSRVPVQATVTATATTTSTAPCGSPTIFADMAGCPGVNHSTQNSTGSDVSYVILCATQITSPQGENIDAFNSVQTSLGDCLNACATYRNKECVAVTWYQFWPANPAWNSVCFLKNGTGINTTLPDSEKIGYAASAILSSLVVQ